MSEVKEAAGGQKIITSTHFGNELTIVSSYSPISPILEPRPKVLISST